MRGGDSFQLLVSFREGDKEAALTPRPTFEQKLQPKGCLARPRDALHQVKPTGHQTTTQYRVKAGNAGRNPRRLE